jgi:hypothetical protein
MLRRLGKCRGELPASRRHCLDDGQGRSDHGPVGGGDYGAHKQGSRRALPGADSGVRHALLHAHRCAGHACRKARPQKLSPAAVNESDLAGEPIIARLTQAPGNDAPIGGLKVVARSGWFAARPSRTENNYKIYAELPGREAPRGHRRRGPADREQCPGGRAVRRA